MRLSANASKRAVLLDTGPLVAAIDRGDLHHEWARRTLPQLQGTVRTCESVIAEALHLLGNDTRAIAALQRILTRIEIVPVFPEEFSAVFSLISDFAPRMDLADGCLVVLSAVYDGAIVVTTDTKDFSSYQIPFASPAGLFA